MIEILSENLIINFFFVLIYNLLVFYLINFLISKNKILIDIKNTSSHKQLINSDLVPISGGLVIFLNLLLYNYFNLFNKILIIALFLLGLLADIQKLNSPLKRLIFQTVIIAIFVFINELFLRSIRISFFDIYLNYNFFSLIFTSFCLLILINGSNFIDGSNLQCSGYYLVILIILIYLDSSILIIENLVLINFILPILLSFTCYNFLNKSYLGDGGTYLLSFIVGYILINFHINQNVSPYYIVLFLWYPAFENLFSILRRFLSKKLRPDKPDLLHLHHLIFRYINDNFNFNNKLKFSMSGIVINIFNLIIFYIGSFFLYSTTKLLILIFFCIFVYLTSYFVLLKKLKLSND